MIQLAHIGVFIEMTASMLALLLNLNYIIEQQNDETRWRHWLCAINVNFI